MAEQGRDNRLAAVQVKLCDILARHGLWSVKVDDERTINHLSVTVDQQSQ